MRQVEPKVFLTHVSNNYYYFVPSSDDRTRIISGLDMYLREIGAVGVEEKDDWVTDAESTADQLVEVAGRVCYRSWFSHDPERPDCTNPNVDRVREGNEAYVGNILKVGHGSVLEHANFTFIFHNVSRVFTHEIVRHRAGCAYSQESLRYVRLDALKVWVPGSLGSLEGMIRAKATNFDHVSPLSLFLQAIDYLERAQVALGDALGIDSVKDFKTKKRLTSLMRRIAPLGLATTVMVTANARAWRHILAMRGSEAAEEEMLVVMPQVARLLKEAAPAIFQDVTVHEDGTVTLEHPKV